MLSALRHSVLRTSKYGESNVIVLEELLLYAGNPVTKVLLKLILSVHRISRWHYNRIPAESKFKTLLARSSRKHYCQIYQMVKHMLRGRLLASFQDLEHEGGDTRSQGGIKDNDSKIKIQDHWRKNDHSNELPRTRLQVLRKVHLNDHPLGGDC
uniref:Uncharacterized protein n=1 Tax=Tanacetum cinerariifolium TaxID=118510 RepID=A0A6L2M116_TANCI|nr:hypothetical protein [Tanacetum cinerariifolium]